MSRGRRRKRKRSRSKSSTTRRAVLLLASGVGGLAWLHGSGAFSSAEVDRASTVSAASDDNALLKLTGFDESAVYEEPHLVTVENQTGSVLDGTNNATSTGELELREENSNQSSDTYSIGSLEPGENESFEIVTSSNRSGEVTDTITLSLSGSELSFDADRTLTVEFNAAGGQLVYSDNGQLTVYDAAKDEVLTPPQTPSDVEIIGPIAVDILDDGDANIPYLDNNQIYATAVGATDDTTIFDDNKPDLKNQKTRLAVGRWPPANELSGDIILSANQNASDIIGVDVERKHGTTEVTTEVLAEPEDGADGIAGAVDFDGDGEVEIVFADSSQQMRYLEQDENVEKIENGGVGSNNSTGFGPPADFGNGIEVPFIDGSNNPAVVDSRGNKTVLDQTGPARKATVAPVDIDGDDEFEFMFIGEDNGNIKYVDNVRDTNDIKTLQINGNTVSPVEKVGLNS